MNQETEQQIKDEAIYGECGNHPGNNLANCIHCAAENHVTSIYGPYWKAGADSNPLNMLSAYIAGRTVNIEEVERLRALLQKIIDLKNSATSTKELFPVLQAINEADEALKQVK